MKIRQKNPEFLSHLHLPVLLYGGPFRQLRGRIGENLKENAYFWFVQICVLWVWNLLLEAIKATTKMATIMASRAAATTASVRTKVWRSSSICWNIKIISWRKPWTWRIHFPPTLSKRQINDILPHGSVGSPSVAGVCAPYHSWSRGGSPIPLFSSRN